MSVHRIVVYPFILSQTMQILLQVNTIIGCLWVPHCLHSHPHTAFCSSATRTQPFVQLTHLVDLKYSMISEHDFRTCWPCFFFPNSGIWNFGIPQTHQTQPASPGVILILLKSARRYSSEDFAFLSQLVAESNGRWFFLRGSVVGCCWDIHPAYPNPMHKWIHIYIVIYIVIYI